MVSPSMKSWHRSLSSLKLVCLIAVLWLVGCAQFYQGPGGRLAQVEALVEQQDFIKAQKLLSDISVDDPDYQALVTRRRALGPLIEQYEFNRVRESERLRAEEKWPDALQVLDEALKKVPRSEALTSARAEFIAARGLRQAELQLELNVLLGRQLPVQTAILEKITALDPERLGNRWQMYTHQRQLEDLSDNLLDCGREAIASKNLTLANNCLASVPRLTADADKSKEGERLQALVVQKQQQQALRERELAAQRADKLAQKRAQRLARLKDQYRDLVAAGWWVAARGKLARLHRLSPNDAEVKRWQVELQQQIDSRVSLVIKQGEALYSQGHLHEALRVWQQGAKLDPANRELQNHIARVERFLEKLDQLDTPEG